MSALACRRVVCEMHSCTKCTIACFSLICASHCALIPLFFACPSSVHHTALSFTYSCFARPFSLCVTLRFHFTLFFACLSNLCVTLRFHLSLFFACLSNLCVRLRFHLSLFFACLSQPVRHIAISFISLLCLSNLRCEAREHRFGRRGVGGPHLFGRLWRRTGKGLQRVPNGELTT
jgi:hypothetical protein